jgi:MFS superfamily sulfate permease-like transporter
MLKSIHPTPTSIINVPQGMGYAVLGTLSPVYGLYTALWPAVIYPIFGSIFF